MSETPSIDSLLEQWIAAFNSRDLDAHMALYEPDAVLFGSVDELRSVASASAPISPAARRP